MTSLYGYPLNMLPRATYDPEARALVIDLAEGTVAGTIAFPDDAHLVDIDSDGRVLSLEILSPDLRLDEIATRFDLKDQLAAISTAADSVLMAQTGKSWTFVEQVQATVHLSVGTFTAVHSASGAWAPARELDLIQ
jgi:uncharacterized protein YuzE